MCYLYSIFTKCINDQLSSHPPSPLNLAAARPRLILAFSGGVDSRVLLELLAQYQLQNSHIECLAVHVHHGLSSNADEWVMQCRSWCQKSKVTLHIERIQLDLEQGGGIEKLARDGRYQALAKYVTDNDIVITGQHADDQLETFLLALKRGSGPKGLSCMAESMSFDRGFLVRPLLAVARRDIEHFAHSQQLEWVEDESNQQTRFDRNFIRHHVTPTLTQRWPTLRQAVQRSASLCAEQEALLDELLARPFQHALQADLSLSMEALRHHSKAARARLIRMWLAHLGHSMPSREQLNLIWTQVACARQDANPQLQLTNATIRRFDSKLYLIKPCTDVSQWQHDLQINSPLMLPDGLGTATLNSDVSAVSAAHLRLSLPQGDGRLWVSFAPEGLSAHPEGRGHSRKLKKLFQELGVPSWLRRRTPILMWNDTVVAIAELFVDQAFSGQECELVWDKMTDSCENYHYK